MFVFTYFEQPSIEPPEQIKRRCSRVANPCAMSLLGASLFANMFLALMSEL